MVPGEHLPNPQSHALEALIARHRQGDEAAFPHLLACLGPWRAQRVGWWSRHGYPWLRREEVHVEVDLAIWQVVDTRFNETRDDRNIYACLDQQIRARIGPLLRQRRQLSETQRQHAPRVYAA